MAPDNLRQCLQSALYMIGRRDHGVEEIRSKLVSKGFSTAAIHAAIADCIRLDYLNDERFAAGVVLAGQRRGYGPRRIMQKLLATGIDGDLAMRMLTEHFDEDRQVAICREVLAKKTRNSPAPPDDPAKYKAGLFRFLHARGFSIDTIRQVLTIAID